MKDYEETGMYKKIFLDYIVFKEVRKTLDGRLCFLLVGLTPIDSYIINFLRWFLSTEIMEGYGQTEDMAGILLTMTCDPVAQHLGVLEFWLN